VTDRIAQRPPWSYPGDPIYRAGKETTNIAGLNLLAQPLPILVKLCRNTLTQLEAVPPTAVYRSATEAIVRHRLQVVEAAAGKEGHDGGEEAVERVERELGLGFVEEVIQIAEDEERLVKRMLEWKPWEDLVEKPLPRQWCVLAPAPFDRHPHLAHREYFKMAPSTTNPEEVPTSS
jgi:NADH dehydrogenase (ubiquinone) 1 alpha subcomplex subunit 5